MRNICAAILSVALISSSALAAEAVGALPVGKPAGVKTAQDANSDSTILFVVGGIGLAGLIGLGLANNNNSGIGASNNIATPTTTT